jgi:hypothetical protein
MTLVDLITLGLIRTDSQAEKFAEQLVDCWHRDLVPGKLPDVLGLTHREYQAWNNGWCVAPDHCSLAPDEPSSAGCQQAVVQTFRPARP